MQLGDFYINHFFNSLIEFETHIMHMPTSARTAPHIPAKPKSDRVRTDILTAREIIILNLTVL